MSRYKEEFDTIMFCTNTSNQKHHTIFYTYFLIAAAAVTFPKEGERALVERLRQTTFDRKVLRSIPVSRKLFLGLM